MKKFFDFVNERKLASILGTTTISISIDLTKHGDERKLRHGEESIIMDSEIIATCDKAKNKITELLANDDLNTDEKFLIFNKETFLNCVVILEKMKGYLNLKVITVMRKEDFKIDKDMRKLVV